VGILAASGAAAYEPDEVYWAPGGCTPPCGLFEVTGGDQSGSSPMGSIDRAPGQVAWSADGAAYVSQFDLDSVARVADSGTVTTFATGVDGPTGVLLTQGGLLLVVSFRDRAVYEADAGGDLSHAPVFAGGFGGPRNLVQLDGGEILLADQGRNVVYDISGGGNFVGATPFASGFPPGPYDLVQDGEGRVFASTDGAVYEITNGGDVSGASPHATGQEFMGLAVDGSGRLLASDFSSGAVFDITASGDYSGATPFATNLAGFGDTALDTVPEAGGASPQAVPALPALGRLLLAASLAALAAGRLARGSHPR
jgi:DNA-binding beta-propeller fold protein YncE